MKRFQSNAFTLLEVLVVVAVIALLLAILVPSLSKAREQARRTQCASNLKNLAFAWQALLHGTDGVFPQYTNVNFTYGGKQGIGSSQYRWPKAKRPLNRQLGLDPRGSSDADVFHCPDDTGTSLTMGHTNYDHVGTSYYANDMLIGQTKMQEIPADPCLDLKKTLNRRLPMLTQSRIDTADRLLLIGDAPWYYMQKDTSTIRTDWHFQRYRHNLAFMDGHVSFIEIHKGLYVTSQYTVIPFRDLSELAAGCQQEVPAP